MKPGARHVGDDHAWVLHVERAFKIVPDEQGIVFCSLGEHAVAAVGAFEVEAAWGLAFEAVQRGCGFGEGDDVQIPIVVVIHDGGQIHAQANDRQVTGVRPNQVEGGEKGDRVRIERRALPGLGGVGEHPNAVLVAREDVWFAVAIVIAKQAPIHHVRPSFGPVPPQGQILARNALEHQHSAAVAVEREQVVVAVEVGVKRRPLRSRKSADPGVRQRHLVQHHRPRAGHPTWWHLLGVREG